MCDPTNKEEQIIDPEHQTLVKKDDGTVAAPAPTTPATNQDSPAVFYAKSFGRFLGVLASLWVFLVGLGLMGNAFKVLGGKSAGKLFTGVSNPIAGVMIGILATVLVQSSSTSTSVVVGLVAGEILTVHQAIPIIMGANIGTSVTNTIVSMGHITNKDEFRRGFAGATVHDMFNYLTVLVMLPLELITDAFNGGKGGYLEVVSAALNLEGGEDNTFDSPVKVLTSFAVKAIVDVDKNKIKALSLGTPTLETCVKSTVAKIDFDICGNQTKFEAASTAFKKIEEGSVIKGGALESMDNGTGGVIALVISFVLLIGGLIALVAVLRSLVLNKQGGDDESWFARISRKQMNPYVAMIFGMLATAAVQSSSIVTSTLVPFVALGNIELEAMLPLTLGANIGTTGTALLAALAAGKAAGLQIAMCHLLFNITGILIWYPLPVTRALPLNAARSLGYLTVCFPWFAFAYLGFAFVFTPLFFLGVSSLMSSGDLGLAFGWIILIMVLFGGLGFTYYYKSKGGNQVIGAYLQTKYDARATDDMKKADGVEMAEKAAPPAAIV